VLLDNVSKTLEESISRMTLNKYLTNNPLPQRRSIEIVGGPETSKDKIIESANETYNWQKQTSPFQLSQPIGI